LTTNSILDTNGSLGLLPDQGQFPDNNASLRYQSPGHQDISHSAEIYTRNLEDFRKQENKSTIDDLPKRFQKEIRKTYQKRIDSLTGLTKTLTDPKFPVQNLGKVLCSEGNRKHADRGRLEVAAIEIGGAVLENA
jgi:hypothetical protein